MSNKITFFFYRLIKARFLSFAVPSGANANFNLFSSSCPTVPGCLRSSGFWNANSGRMTRAASLTGVFSDSAGGGNFGGANLRVTTFDYEPKVYGEKVKVLQKVLLIWLAEKHRFYLLCRMLGRWWPLMGLRKRFSPRDTRSSWWTNWQSKGKQALLKFNKIRKKYLGNFVLFRRLNFVPSVRNPSDGNKWGAFIKSNETFNGLSGKQIFSQHFSKHMEK